MHMIDFQNIRHLGASRQEAFEELCCQIFYHMPNAVEITEMEYSRLNGAGGDGGVEALWVCKNGDKWGLQAKYFSSLGPSQIKQITHSLETALLNHPELKRYIVCVPINLTGKTSGGSRGKSQIEKLDEWKQGTCQRLLDRGIVLSIEFWTESILRERLISADPEGGMCRYWFDVEIMTDEWFSEKLLEAQRQAGKRYTPSLSVKVPAYSALEAFACTDSWQEDANALTSSLSKVVMEWNHDMLIPGNLTEEAGSLSHSISTQLSLVQDDLANYVCLKSDYNVTQLGASILSLLGEVHRLEDILLCDLKDRYESFRDTPNFRQFMQENMCSFPTRYLDVTRNLMFTIEKARQYFNSVVSILPRSRFLLLKGSAGVGKTHAIIDHALHRGQQNQKCLVLFGEDFYDCEPWQVIANKLGLISSSKDEFWSTINAAAEASNQYAIIYIDALNEIEVNARKKWKQYWLSAICHQIEKYPKLKLCVSCRDTYLDEVFEERTIWAEFEHNGFAGQELDAIEQFFSYYKLKLPTVPLLQLEFGIPLFLHLICQGLKSSGLSSIPLGSMGLTDVLHLIFEGKNKLIAEVCHYDPRDNKVQLSIIALAKAMASSGKRLLPLQTAKNTIDAFLPSYDFDKSLFRQLEKEGLISVVEQCPRQLGPKVSSCRFTFERVADILIALSLLEQANCDNIQEEFAKGILAFTVLSAEAVNEHKGLLEALSIILPERSGIELFDCVNNVTLNDQLLLITYSGFQWRSIESYTDRTEALILCGLDQLNTYKHTVDALLHISVIPRNRFNAEFLNWLLNRNCLVERDSFWSFYLYDSYENHHTVWRLIEWILMTDSDLVVEETAYQFAIILGWFCASPDRRIRDRATKGLVKLFTSLPTIIKRVLVTFGDNDDDYILERISLASYGAALLIEKDAANNSIIRELAKTIHDAVFSPNVTPLNVSIRDNFRLVLELAKDRGLLDNIDFASFRPPYKSQWPITFPSESEVKYLSKAEAFRGSMNLGSFGIGTDFARYILSALILDHYDLQANNLSKKKIYDWFMKSVSELGYPGFNMCAYRYDEFINLKYGQGRSKPVWAERLGKKYYWIILRQLAGILADHLPRSNAYWDIDVHKAAHPLQSIGLRDIDPTDMRAYSKITRSSLDLQKIVPYEFDSSRNLSNEEWLWKNDFPCVENFLTVVDHNETWVRLFLSVTADHPEGSIKNNAYPYRLLSSLLFSAFIPQSACLVMKRRISEEGFYPHIGMYVPDNTKVFFGEYPNSLTCRNCIEAKELSLDCMMPGVENARITTTNLLRGAEYEYDCSQEEIAHDLLAPSPELISYRNLKWDGMYSWLDEHDVVQIQAVQSKEHSCLLIRQRYLHDYLITKSLILVIMSCHEKMLITGSSYSPGIFEFREVLEYSCNGIKNVKKGLRRNGKEAK